MNGFLRIQAGLNSFYIAKFSVDSVIYISTERARAV